MSEFSERHYEERHYKDLAIIIREARDKHTSERAERVILQIERALLELFCIDNPHFDARWFHEACQVRPRGPREEQSRRRAAGENI
ncbi:MAG TPA: hypothetical protein VGU20_18100 [Stellaceae bacterium]|nr:hypothetical protein [Stellaceae bacterium]